MIQRAKKIQPVPEIRLRNPYVSQIIAEEQARSGEPTATATAARMIIERKVALDIERRIHPSVADAARGEVSPPKDSAATPNSTAPNADSQEKNS